MGKTDKDRKDTEDNYKKGKKRDSKNRRESKKLPKNWDSNEIFDTYGDFLGEEQS